MSIEIVDRAPPIPLRIVFRCRWGSCGFEATASGFASEADAARFRAAGAHMRDDHEEIEHGGISLPVWQGRL